MTYQTRGRGRHTGSVPLTRICAVLNAPPMLSPRTRNWNIQSASLPNLDDCRPCTQLPNTKHCPACLTQLQFPVKFHMAAHLDAPTQSTKSTFSHRRGLEDHWNTVPDLHDVTRTAPRRMQIENLRQRPDPYILPELLRSHGRCWRGYACDVRVHYLQTASS